MDHAADPRSGRSHATLAARLHAATYALLVMLREFDERGGWGGGFSSCAHWLSWRTGIDPGAAREKVRVAQALATLPLLSAALAEGRLSYAKVRALTRVARPETEQSLLSVALATTAAQVERLVGAWRRVDALKAAREDARRHLARGLSVWVDDDGMVVVRGRLSPEQGAVLQRALDAATDRLWQESRAAASDGTFEDDVTPTQRRADALVRVAEAALSADLDAGTAGDRYQVVLHVAAAAAETCEPPCADPPATPLDGGTLELGDGATYVSAETSARLSCDAAVVRMHHAEDGAVLDVGRKARTVPSAIRRAHGLLKTVIAGSPAARRAGAMPIMSSTGRTAGRRAWTISCCCVGATIGRCEPAVQKALEQRLLDAYDEITKSS